MTIVAVGDPDQSIYGFRSDVPADIATFLGQARRGSVSTGLPLVFGDLRSRR
ncbi:MAG: UvrD-helicase domain-containing protein [Nocardioides sp.]